MTHSFHPTCWTLVLRSGVTDPEARIALSDLCEAYYGPVVGFLRREGRDEDRAREMAHAFFAQVLAGGLGTPDPSRGRFRSYLLGCLKHFLANRFRAEQAVKRGGRIEHVPLGEGGEEAFEGNGAAEDWLRFDREWALALIARALGRLEGEHAKDAKRFETLKPWLDGGEPVSQAEAARALGMTENAVKVAIHRLRIRLRELIREEVASTVHDPTEAADELRHLIAVVSRL